MDIERTMQFIVDHTAALTVRQEQADIRAARMDRRMAGLQTLVKTGMRMIVKLEQGQRTLNERMAELAEAQSRTEKALADLAASQKRTDQKFDRWLDSINTGSNGHRKKPN